MATQDKEGTVTFEELAVYGVATVDALAKLLIKKGVVTQEEFIRQLFGDKSTYRGLLEKVRSTTKV